MMRDGPVRVLLIDDQPLQRQAVAAELDRVGDLHAVTCSGEQAEIRQRLTQFHPEVVLLALDLRSQDPLALLRTLREHYPVPVIVTTEAQGLNADRAVRAAAEGALDVVRRPDGRGREALAVYARELAERIHGAVQLARPVRLAPQGPRTPRGVEGCDPRQYLVVIGASTGGTQALAALLEQTPVDFPAVAIVQHMPPGFTRSFAERLNRGCALRVTEAADGDPLGPGRAVVARGDTHLTVAGSPGAWHARYTDQTPVNRHCPSVDVLFESAAVWGRRVIGVLLTGMGADGARGLLRLRQCGALTIAQNEASCVVYGMPREAVRMGAAALEASPADIPALILKTLSARARPTAARTT